ncbi:uncharacterized protein LOC124254500 isoform X1 [Haliotis rubra]|uniref:uncharacterized protein LOC124254500 isoform X1 n=1 Tax=Haliotis rubra TaxID=36100 RepID=UPI001EE593F0|nr:uncharacterized protein LOC124254500 isoform X1 [Haliotis rubra]
MEAIKENEQTPQQKTEPRRSIQESQGKKDKDTSLRYNNETRRSVQESEGSSTQPDGVLHRNPRTDLRRSVRHKTGVPYKLFKQLYGPEWKDLVKELTDECSYFVRAYWYQRAGKAIIRILYLKNDEESVFTFLEKFEVIHVYTDACLEGIGGYWENKSGTYFFSEKLNLPTDVCIHDVEMLAVTVAMRVWSGKWGSKIVCVHTDNTTVVFAFEHIQNCEKNIGKRRRQMLEKIKKDKDFNKICLRCEYIKGTQNTKADHLSRDDVNSFKELFSHDTSFEETQVKDIAENLLSECF